MAAIGFKAVHGGRISGVQRVTPEVLAAMEEMSDVAPAHNPPYIAAMRLLSEKLPEIPLVAAFETGFHATDSRPQPLLRRRRTSGPRSTTSSGGAFTAPAIATSPRERPNCWAATICGSSPATWADRVRCVRFAAARAWRPAWA